MGAILTAVKCCGGQMSESARLATYPGAGERLNQLMFQRRITRTRLADRAGVSRETVAQALNDRVSPRSAAKMAFVLEVSPDEILYGPGTSGLLLDVTDSGDRYPQLPDTGSPDRLRERRAGEWGADEQQLAEFVDEMDRLVRTLSSSGGGLPVEAKIAILNGFEEAARLAGRRVPPAYWELRRSILDKAADGGRADGGATEPG